MKFREFITESELTDLHAEIAHHMSNGMIPNPTFQELKRRVDKHVERKGQSVFNQHCVGKGNEFYNLDPALGDLVYATPSNSNEVGHMKKKLAKVSVKNHPFYTAMSQLHQELTPLADKMQHLKTMVVKTTAIRAAAKQEKEVVRKKKLGDPASLHKALTTHLEEFKAKAHEYAGEHYDTMMQHMEKHGWDISKAAPKPDSLKDSKESYQTKKAWRNKLMSMTEPKSSSDPSGLIRKSSKKVRAAYQEQAKQNAHDEYMSWVHKMTDKIGKPVAEASVSGSPWTGSRLHVVTHDGEEQKWNTKMIINRSKYNNLFNQFPTRKVK